MVMEELAHNDDSIGSLFGLHVDNDFYCISFFNMKNSQQDNERVIPSLHLIEKNFVIVVSIYRSIKLDSKIR